MTDFLPTQPYKGSRDFYPEDKRVHDFIFAKCREVVQRYGYREYDGPILEPFELYAAKSGEEIVNTQLYSFTDRGDRRVAIRPEMTPTLARMVAAKFQELPKPIRWFSVPNLWRYERPQRGRLREHWQLNVDLLGGDRGLADLEIVQIAVALLSNFGAPKQSFEIRVNHRGLVDALFREELKLEPAAALKLVKLVDAKAKMKPEAYAAGLLTLGLDEKAQARLDAFFALRLENLASEFPGPASAELGTLLQTLGDLGLSEAVRLDTTIMRGLDYYTGLVFEAFDLNPENNRALFGGGRYDNLIGLFGKQSLSGVGFGMGDVTLRNFLEGHRLLPEFSSFADVFVTCPSRNELEAALAISAELRGAGLRVVDALSFEGFGAQLKSAAKQGCVFAVLLGEDEIRRGVLAVKDLRSGQQFEVERRGLAGRLQQSLRPAL